MDDYRWDTCPECGGWLYYVHSLNYVGCDCCDYEIKEVC